VPSIRHPRQKIAIAALAIGFWSQVVLLRGLIHRDRDEPGCAVSDVELTPPPAPAPPPPTNRHLFGVRPTVPSPRPTLHDAEVARAMKAAAPALRAHRADLPLRTRLDLRVSASAKGRVTQVTVESTPERLSPVGHRAVVRAFEKIPFPKSSGPYTVEFPILLRGNE
jgi:hypothetical protein